MKLIKWHDEYNTGIASVDHEHQELIELINSLNDAMRSETTQDEVLDMLGEVYAQISAHFALEEKYMRDHRYPAYVEHKNDHEILLDELRELMDVVDAEGSYDELQLSEDLRRWFSEHFSTHDAKLHAMQHR